MPATRSRAVPAGMRRLQNRDRLEADIAAVAVRVFAECGYEGASVAAIAQGAGLSKQNLMYYFPSKQALYQRVLDDVLDDWLVRMERLADAEQYPDQDPRDVLRAYIQAKMKFSREQPHGSRVYAMEVISGAPLYGRQIRERVVPLLRKDIAVFQKWIAAGRIAPVDATHLIFMIWAMTQSYADFSCQMSLVLGRRQLARKDYEDGEETILRMVMAAIGRPEAECRAAMPPGG